MKSVAMLIMLLLALDAAGALSANLTSWHHHRRQKRFLIFQDGGIVKTVTGLAFPVDFQEKLAWRQLVWLMNFHYQFPEPTAPLYWWKLWSGRNLKGPLKLDKAQRLQQQQREEQLLPSVDEPQKFLFEFAEEYMNQRGQNGRSCLQRLICENAQVHEHNGLYAQLLHRLLTPHSSLAARYVDPFKMGRHGINCRRAYPEAVPCVLDDYVHVHERGLTQSYLRV